MDVLTLDGSHGEGGGQILRTALSLSAITARPFCIVNIRASRRNPGLMPQHLAAVRAAAIISGATVSGDRLGSAELDFAPCHSPTPGSYVFDVAETAERGSAGSATLILHTLLVPLGLAEGASALVLRGGTHVEWSPPFDHVVNSYLPMLYRMGFRMTAELKRPARPRRDRLHRLGKIGRGHRSAPAPHRPAGARGLAADRRPRSRRQPARSYSPAHG